MGEMNCFHIEIFDIKKSSYIPPSREDFAKFLLGGIQKDFFKSSLNSVLLGRVYLT